MLEFKSLDIRPYQLMLIIAKIASGSKDQGEDAYLNKILQTVRENPSIPITLRCQVHSNYSYQNLNEKEESSEDSLFYARCDLKILQKMGMVPGDTRPAVEIFKRLLDCIKTSKGILWFDEATSESWKGLKKGSYYDKGRAMGLEAIIPARDKIELQQFKINSSKLMYKADKLHIRPHHLMCMTCFYGKKEYVPIAEDNLFEAIDIIQSKPEIQIELVCGPCMICPPCHFYDPDTDLCVSHNGMALRDELKDLDVLQILGLKYGDVLSAKELFIKLYTKVHSTTQICGYGDGITLSPEWNVCGDQEGDFSFIKGRTAGLGFL